MRLSREMKKHTTKNDKKLTCFKAADIFLRLDLDPKFPFRDFFA
jgi:hypothetical protein